MIHLFTYQTFTEFVVVQFFRNHAQPHLRIMQRKCFSHFVTSVNLIKKICISFHVYPLLVPVKAGKWKHRVNEFRTNVKQIRQVQAVYLHYALLILLLIKNIYYDIESIHSINPELKRNCVKNGRLCMQVSNLYIFLHTRNKQVSLSVLAGMKCINMSIHKYIPLLANHKFLMYLLITNSANYLLSCLV